MPPPGDRDTSVTPANPQGDSSASFLSPPRCIAFATAVITAAVLVFYIVMRPIGDRNYGGMTNGFRWSFWLAPLWMLVMLPAVDVMARRRWTRLVALLLLVLSVLSVAYATWNPWQQPWITDFLLYIEWISFD